MREIITFSLSSVSSDLICQHSFPSVLGQYRNSSTDLSISYMQDYKNVIDPSTVTARSIRYFDISIINVLYITECLCLDCGSCAVDYQSQSCLSYH